MITWSDVEIALLAIAPGLFTALVIVLVLLGVFRKDFIEVLKDIVR